MWYKYLFFYFLVSSIVASLMLADELEERKERWLFVVIMTIGAPLMALFFALKNFWNWLDARTQITTFFLFVFNKRALIRTEEGLAYIEKIRKEKMNGNSLREQLYRKAVNLIFKVNDYTPDGEENSGSSEEK